MNAEQIAASFIAEWNRECDRRDAQASSVRRHAGRRRDIGRLMTLQWMIRKGRKDLEPLYAQALRDAQGGPIYDD